MVAKSGSSKKKGGGTLLTFRVVVSLIFMLNCYDVSEADTLRVRSGDDLRGILKRICEKNLKVQKLCGSAVGL